MAIHEKIRSLITLLLLFSASYSYAQEENAQGAGLNKNAIYGSVGIAGLYFTATGYYERILTQGGGISSFLRAGVGGYATWGDGGEYVLGQLGILTGRKAHHFEAGAGVYAALSGDLQGTLPLTASLGYRIQKPGGNFIFRTGASWPEAVYVGIGFAL